MILAKLALGAAGTLAVATAYTFHEGTIRVAVAEHGAGGSHVPVWGPAALGPAALHCVPDNKLQEAAAHAHEALPIVKIVAKELENYPNAEFVQVDSTEEHVKVSVHGGKIYVDVQDHGDEVHVAVPVSTIQDVIENISERDKAQ